MANILAKPHEDRTRADYKAMHKFFVSEVPFFSNLMKKENQTKSFLFKIYEVLELKYYEKDDILCKFGEMGDSFFIILEGEVAVKVPTQFERIFATYT